MGSARGRIQLDCLACVLRRLKILTELVSSMCTENKGLCVGCIDIQRLRDHDDQHVFATSLISHRAASTRIVRVIGVNADLAVTCHGLLVVFVHKGLVASRDACLSTAPRAAHHLGVLLLGGQSSCSN